MSRQIKVLRRLSFLWVLLIVPGSALCEDITIPIEWYYGRWPSGHAEEGHFRVSSDKIQFGDGYSAYTYSNGTIRAGVNGFADYLLFSDNDDIFGTADATFGYRPSRNWQISLNSLEYSSRTRRSTSPSPNPSTSTYNSKQLNANVSLDWSNKADVQVSAPWQRYMEYVDRTTGQGQWSSRVMLDSRLTSSHSSSNRIESVETISQSVSESRNNWSFRYFIQGSVSDRWHLSLGVFERINNNSSNSSGLREKFGSQDLITRTLESVVVQPGYRIGNVFNLTKDVFLGVSVSQGFRRGSSTDERFIIESDSIRFSSQTTHRDSPLQENVTIVSSQIDILTEGAFLSSIVLDDYAEYYHKMLFSGQYHGQVSYEYRRDGDASHFNFEKASLRHSSFYGISNKINVGGSINYEWRNSGRRWSSLSSTLDIQWRSYDYNPGSGPGWYGDSPFDIQYGPIKQPGHLFASVTVRPPSWQSHRGLGFLSFGGFRSDKNWLISSTFIAGLLWQSEIRATSSLSLLHNESNVHSFRMTLAKRVLSRFELSVDYFNDPPSRFAQLAGLGDDFQLTFNLRGFL